MKIALLSAGPSLVHTFHNDMAYDLRVGVNAAVNCFHCDWWSCGDGQTFEQIDPIGYPAIFTLDRNDARFKTYKHKAEQLRKHRIETWSRLCGELKPPKEWTNWSVTAAVVLCVYLGAKQIDVYGHDLEGDKDSAGRSIKKRLENWKRVRSDWDAVASWAQGKNVYVAMKGLRECIT